MKTICIPQRNKETGKRDGCVEVECDERDVELISDGYHSFLELYNHRCALFVVIANGMRDLSFKTKRDDKGNEIDGWFILSINTKYGQISYHLPNALWDMSNAKEIVSNDSYDGHTSQDVVLRLEQMLKGGI